MLIEQILNSWDTDCVIPDDDIGGASLRTSNLHAKYLRILIDYKLKKVKYSSELQDMKFLKSKYFKSQLTTEELNDLGWEPFQYRILKTDIDEHINTDKDVQKIQNKLEYCTSAIYTLESILQEIKSRSFHTKVAMEWVKFRAGS